MAKGEQRFSDRRNPLVFKLDAQALLINRFEKSTALLIGQLEAGTDDRVALAFVNDFCHLLFASIRVIRRH